MLDYHNSLKFNFGMNPLRLWDNVRDINTCVRVSLFLTSNKENKHSLHVGAL